MSVVKATLIFSIATYLDVILNPLMGFVSGASTQPQSPRRWQKRRCF